MLKQFAIPADQMRQLVTGYGSCMATDRITVDADPVGYMYREVPDDAQDSGWRFFEGTESPDYLVEAENSEIYSVNTIANYDPAIVPYLDAPVGTALARKGDGFVVEPLPSEED
jgi:hypothetical protein